MYLVLEKYLNSILKRVSCSILKGFGVLWGIVLNDFETLSWVKRCRQTLSLFALIRRALGHKGNSRHATRTHEWMGDSSGKSKEKWQGGRHFRSYIFIDFLSRWISNVRVAVQAIFIACLHFPVIVSSPPAASNRVNRNHHFYV